MEWISVKDKLPDGKLKCLVCLQLDEFIDIRIDYFRIIDSYDNLVNWFNYTNVTHWMPLPELPHQPKLTWQYELKSEPGVWKDATEDEHAAGCDLIRMNWRRVEK